jgi:hypothetical protein
MIPGGRQLCQIVFTGSNNLRYTLPAGGRGILREPDAAVNESEILQEVLRKTGGTNLSTPELE